MKKCIKALALVAAIGAAPAFAQSWYIGGGAGSGNLNKSGQDLTGLSNVTVDDSSTTYTVRGGYRFNPYFALELGYYDLGKYSFTGNAGPIDVVGTGKAKSYGISAVGILPINPQFDLYGRIGWAESELKVQANTALANATDSDRQSEATYGVGGHWMFSRNVGLFAEWMKNDRIKVDSYLIGIDFRF
jgi:OOP family OmpA-OmpF porin